MSVHKLNENLLRPISQRTKFHREAHKAAMVRAWLRTKDPQSLDFAEQNAHEQGQSSVNIWVNDY